MSILFSCGKKSTAEHSVNIPANSNLTELPLPVPPATMSEPQERGAYMVRHFWDALPQLTDEQAADTALIEQSFSNFINLLGYVDSDSIAPAIEILLDKCYPKAQTRQLIDFLAAKYLDDPNSPMRNEDIYLLFLNAVADNPRYDEAQRARAVEKRALAMLNRPGSRAADMRLDMRNGATSTLHSAVKTDTTLVLFYDSDCENCKALINRLTQPGAQIIYPVLAIDVAGNRGLWDAGKATLPASWQVAFATSDPEDAGLYHFPALPSLYLLAPDATVILKDFSI